jgi:hypothetical protein
MIMKPASGHYYGGIEEDLHENGIFISLPIFFCCFFVDSLNETIIN